VVRSHRHRPQRLARISHDKYAIDRATPGAFGDIPEVYLHMFWYFPADFDFVRNKWVAMLALLPAERRPDCTGQLDTSLDYRLNGCR
jgi:hypothetical protein